MYFLPEEQRIGIVAINQLPEIPSTLWIRLLGRGKVQQRAIDELLALPPNYPFRGHALEQLANLRVTIQARQNLTQDERGLIMTLSPAYQQWQAETLNQGRQQGQQEGKINLVLRLLTRKVGAIDESVRSQIEALSLPSIEELGEALLDFSDQTDLIAWLAGRSPEN